MSWKRKKIGKCAPTAGVFECVKFELNVILSLYRKNDSEQDGLSKAKEIL